MKRTKHFVIAAMVGGMALMAGGEAVSGNGPKAMKKQDQLLCTPSYRWPTSGEAADCIQSSDVANIRQLTYAEVIEDGWIIKSAVPRSSGPNGAYIFVKPRPKRRW
ncbi:MAG: hypothetical protein Hals2KO_32580 [Halioglobus sp.]